jgi:hypothetical protein
MNFPAPAFVIINLRRIIRRSYGDDFRRDEETMDSSQNGKNSNEFISPKTHSLSYPSLNSQTKGIRTFIFNICLNLKAMSSSSNNLGLVTKMNEF